MGKDTSLVVINRLIMENQVIMKRVISNLSLIERFALSHLVINPQPINYENERKIFKEIMDNPNIIKEVKKRYRMLLTW